MALEDTLRKAPDEFNVYYDHAQDASGKGMFLSRMKPHLECLGVKFVGKHLKADL